MLGLGRVGVRKATNRQISKPPPQQTSYWTTQLQTEITASMSCNRASSVSGQECDDIEELVIDNSEDDDEHAVPPARPASQPVSQQSAQASSR